MRQLESTYERILNRAKQQQENEKLEIFRSFLKEISIIATHRYEFPPAVIKVNNIPIATCGNFSASVGRPKSRKTFNVCAIAASLLSGKTILNYSTCMPKGKNKVLYIDTEQSRAHCHKVLIRVLDMANIQHEKAENNISFIMLREFNPEERRDIIEMALSLDDTIGFVIIDGIRDLISDINSPSESVSIINDLMRWSSKYNIHIHTVLHLNKRDDNARGHIGTELSNKAEAVLKVVKLADNPTISEVRPMITRDQEFEDFAFRINDQAMPELTTANNHSKEVTKTSKTMTIENHKEVLETVFQGSKPMKYGAFISALREAYANIGYDRSRTSIVNLSKIFTNFGVIEQLQNKLYIYNPDKIKDIEI
jgi:hypothetical protein